MLRESDGVVLRDERSLRLRILAWLYPNRGWTGDSRYPGAAGGVKPAAKLATGIAADASKSSTPRREAVTSAV